MPYNHVAGATPNNGNMPISLEGILRCGDCLNDDARNFVEDYRSGDMVCLLCGRVVPHQVTFAHQHVDDKRGEYRSVALGFASRLPAARPRPLSSPYQRVYHYAELMASYYDRDPLIDEAILDMVLANVRARAQASGRCLREVVPRLCSEDIHEICRSIGDPRKQPYKCYGERFVKIKKWLSGKVGSPMVPDYWAPWEVEQKMKEDFRHINGAFDDTLYISGRKLTQKDNDNKKTKKGSDNKQARRHNMPKYNFVIRELLWKNAPQIYHRCEVDFFFPLPRTPKVLAKLVKMYNIMAGQCGFPLSMWTGYPVQAIRVPKWDYDEYKMRKPYPLNKVELTPYEWFGTGAAIDTLAVAAATTTTTNDAMEVEWIKC